MTANKCLGVNDRQSQMCLSFSSSTLILYNIFDHKSNLSTYGHRLWRTRHPVRSALFKPQIDCVVVWWVTTCEFQLLYVQNLFVNFFCPSLALKEIYVEHKVFGTSVHSIPLRHPFAPLVPSVHKGIACRGERPVPVEANTHFMIRNGFKSGLIQEKCFNMMDDDSQSVP